jgi:hypothetical protein
MVAGALQLLERLPGRRSARDQQAARDRRRLGSASVRTPYRAREAVPRTAPHGVGGDLARPAVRGGRRTDARGAPITLR